MLPNLAATDQALTRACQGFGYNVKSLLVLATTHRDLAATVGVLRQQFVIWVRLGKSFSVLSVGKSFHGYSMAHPWRMRQYPLASYPPDDASTTNNRHISKAAQNSFQPRELLISQRLIAIVAIRTNIVVELGVLNL